MASIIQDPRLVEPQHHNGLFSISRSDSDFQIFRPHLSLGIVSGFFSDIGTNTPRMNGPSISLTNRSPIFGKNILFERRRPSL